MDAAEPEKDQAPNEMQIDETTKPEDEFKSLMKKGDKNRTVEEDKRLQE